MTKRQMELQGQAATQQAINTNATKRVQLCSMTINEEIIQQILTASFALCSLKSNTPKSNEANELLAAYSLQSRSSPNFAGTPEAEAEPIPFSNVAIDVGVTCTIHRPKAMRYTV